MVEKLENFNILSMKRFFVGLDGYVIVGSPTLVFHLHLGNNPVFYYQESDFFRKVSVHYMITVSCSTDQIFRVGFWKAENQVWVIPGRHAVLVQSLRATFLALLCLYPDFSSYAHI